MANLTVAEAARRMGVDPSLVRRYIREGRLRAERFGAVWVVTERSLRAFEARPRPVGRPPHVAP